jgi:hypothetical protein
MDCGTRKLDIVSDTGVLRKQSLFYGRVEAYFAVYDSVVLTGPSKLDPYQPEIEALLGNGSTQKFIAKRYGTTAGNLHNWLKKRGIKRAKG